MQIFIGPALAILADVAPRPGIMDNQMLFNVFFEVAYNMLKASPEYDFAGGTGQRFPDAVKLSLFICNKKFTFRIRKEAAPIPNQKRSSTETKNQK